MATGTNSALLPSVLEEGAATQGQTELLNAAQETIRPQRKGVLLPWGLGK